MEDLIDADFGKHDYDWLLTPPETPNVPSQKASKQETTSPVLKSKPTRSVSTARAAVVAPSQLQHVHPTKQTRSSSVTRPSIIRTHSSLANISMLKTKPSLNTHTISPRNQTSTKAKPIPKTQSTSSNSSSPRLHIISNSTSKASVHEVISPVLKSKPLRSVSTTRASKVPSSHSQTTHPTKPTRSSSVTRPSILRTHSSLTNNNESKKLNTGALKALTPSNNLSSTRPLLKAKPQHTNSNSSSPRLNSSLNSTTSQKPSNHQRAPPEKRATSTGRPSRAPVHPIEILNLSSGGPQLHRSSSVGSLHNAVSGVVDSKSLEHSPRAQFQKDVLPEGGARRINKCGSGFGRNISKNSIDMALRHMDIKQNIGGIRSKSIIPPIIRSASQKTHASVKENSKYCAIASLKSEAVTSPTPRPSKNDSCINASTQHEAMLSNEDENNLNWLHSTEDMSDQSAVFDHGFEPLPEPFGLPHS